MRKTFLIGGLLISTMLLSACSMQPRLYQQQPPSNLNNGSEVTPPKDVGVPDTVDSVEEVIEGAYIENVECGYLSFEPKPENGIVYLISDEADIEIAETRLGMKIPDDADWPEDYEAKHVEAFQDFKSKYPIEQYSYIFLYSEYSCLGYYSHADQVIIRNGNELLFHYDVVESPAEGEAVCDAMDGQFKIAAIPKDIFITRTFRFVVRPSEMEFEN